MAEKFRVVLSNGTFMEIVGDVDRVEIEGGYTVFYGDGGDIIACYWQPIGITKLQEEDGESER